MLLAKLPLHHRRDRRSRRSLQPFAPVPVRTAVGLGFDGAVSRGRGRAADSASLNIAGSAITIEAWVKLQRRDAWEHMGAVGRWIIDAGGFNCWHGLAGYGNGKQWRIGLVIGGVYRAAVAGLTLPDGQWMHLAGSYDGQMLRLFVEGSLAAVTAASGNLSVNNNPWYVGAKKSDDYFRGAIDEIRISDTARYTTGFLPLTGPFTPDPRTRALWHLQENAGTSSADATPNGNTLALENARWTEGKF